MRENSCNPILERPNQDGEIWKLIWKLSVPNKVPNFLWRSCREEIPVKKESDEAKNPSIRSVRPLQWRTRKRAPRPLEVFSHLTGLEFSPWHRLQPYTEFLHHIKPHSSCSEGRKGCGKAGNGAVDNLVSKKPDTSEEWRLSYLKGSPKCISSSRRLQKS